MLGMVRLALRTTWMPSTYESDASPPLPLLMNIAYSTHPPPRSVAFQVNYMDARGELDDDAELEAELDAERDQDYDSQDSGGDDASSSSDDEDEDYLVVSAAVPCPPGGMVIQ